MPSRDLVDARDSADRQIEKYRKIVTALMRRVERDTANTGDAFSLFQRSVELESEVRARTNELQRTLAALNRANDELESVSAAAAAANRAKSRFLAAASHDLLQPLNAAKLFAESLREGPQSSTQAATLGRLGIALDSVEKIISALLDISKLDTQAVTPEIARLPVSAVLGAIETEFRPIAAEQGVGIRFVPSDAWVESDPQFLRQIVQNLVSNAVRYCEGGRVTVGCRRRGATLRIEVHDTGPGIAAEEIPRLFEEFSRGQGADRDGQGLGLGLAIVDRACKLLGHRLDVRSQPGRGTVFAVELPMAPAGGQETGADTRICLVIGADPSLAADLERLLASWHVIVLIADTAADGHSLMSEIGICPDIVMLDEPRDSDIAQFSACPARFVALSSGGDPVPEGVVALEKPVRPHSLRACINLPGSHEG